MIKSFSVKNFKSFIDEQTIVFDDNINLITLFSLNGKGKTNFLNAINQFQRLYIFYSYNRSFRIIDKTPDDLTMPTSFKIEIILSNKNYSYAYSYASDEIVSEELIIDNQEIFKRVNNKIETYKDLDLFLFNTKRDIDTYKNELGTRQFFLPLLVSKNVDYLGLKELDRYIGNFILNDISGNKYDADETANKISDYSIDVDFLKDILAKTDDTIVDFEMKPDIKIRTIERLKADLESNNDDIGFLQYTQRRLNREENRKKIVYYTVDGMQFEYDSLSYGTKKMLNLAINLAIAVKENKLILIDEIENGLNAFLVRFILNLVKNSDSRMICTTHSIDVLDFLDDEEIFIITRDNLKYSSVLTQFNRSIIDSNNLKEAYFRGEIGNFPKLR